ncbi:MAG: hypothetical protein WA890_08440, partial [Micromonospora sp.]
MSRNPKWMPWQRARLRSYIEEALANQDNYDKALAMAQLVDDGQWRLISSFKMGDDGQLIRDSHSYRVELLCSDGWAVLCQVPHQLVGLSDEQLDDELQSTLAQREMGLTIGPDDPPVDNWGLA